jgi:hypothetical protein
MAGFLIDLVETDPFGFRGRRNRFNQNGHGDTAQSWINAGPNKDISPPQLKQAIGSDVLEKLEQQTGLSQDSFAGSSFPAGHSKPRFRPAPRNHPTQREFVLKEIQEVTS